MTNLLASAVDDGYGGIVYQPTMAGYGLMIAAIVIFLLIGASMRARLSTLSGGNRSVDTKELSFSSMAIALAMVLSMIPMPKMPMGGHVTLFSLLVITLIGYWYGLSSGITCGLAYGMLQLLLDPYIISLPQLFCDYIFAYAALGLSGLFSQKENGLLPGYIVAVLGRYVFAVLSGVVFFASYAPDSGVLSNPVLYSAVYNGTYIFAEAAMTIVILLLPPVKKALNSVRSMAIDG